MKKELLHITTAKQLLKDIKKSNNNKLPPIHILAGKYDVGEITMRKAVHYLSDLKILSCTRGKQVQINNTKQDDNSAVKFSKKIESKIISGEILKNEKLQKFEYYAIKEHISLRTISNAFKILEEKKLIHKKGRKWIVGSNETSDVLNNYKYISSTKPVVLSICQDQFEWRLYWEDPKFKLFQFGQNFFKVIENSDTTIMHAYIDSNETDNTFPVGEEQIQNLIKSLGKQLIGILLLSSFRNPIQKRFIQTLLTHKKTLVWFCPDPKNLFFQRNELKNSNDYAFCRYSETNSVDIAIKTLINLGHRVIGVPFAIYPKGKKYSWIVERKNLIEKISQKYKNSISVIYEEQNESLWFYDRWTEYEDDFATFFESDLEKNFKNIKGQGVRNNNQILKDALKAMSPSLFKLIAYPNLTALITPDNLITRLYIHWFSKLGLKIPRNISLLTFDNDIRSKFYPISTIDFGIGELGYNAGNFITKNDAVNVNKNGEIINNPKLLDRGSLTKYSNTKPFYS